MAAAWRGALLAGWCGVAGALSVSGGWGIDVSDGGNRSWINLMYQVSEEVSIRGAHAGVPSLYYFAWTEPDSSRADPVTGMCPSRIPRFHNTTRCKTLRHDYQAAWDTAYRALKPFIANRTYVGVFLGDENIWDGASLEHLTAVTDMIKRDWPESIIYINEAQDVVNCNFNRLGEPFFKAGQCLPETLDWFGYDYYCTIPGCKDAYGAESGWQVQQDGMKNMIYPRLTRPDQKVVPTTLGFFYLTTPFNASEQATMDDYCVYNAERFLDWGRADSRVVGMFPFYWHSGSGNIGLADLPRCRAKWVSIGEEVVSHVGALPNGGGVPGQSHANRCPSPEEKVDHKWCTFY